LIVLILDVSLNITHNSNIVVILVSISSMNLIKLKDSLIFPYMTYMF